MDPMNVRVRPVGVVMEDVKFSFVKLGVASGKFIDVLTSLKEYLKATILVAVLFAALVFGTAINPPDPKTGTRASGLYRAFQYFSAFSVIFAVANVFICFIWYSILTFTFAESVFTELMDKFGSTIFFPAVLTVFQVLAFAVAGVLGFSLQATRTDAIVIGALSGIVTMLILMFFPWIWHNFVQISKRIAKS
jgi:hypothetical protein